MSNKAISKTNNQPRRSLFLTSRLFPILLVLGLAATVPLQADATGFGSSTTTADPRALKAAAFQKYIEGDLEEARAIYERAIQAGTAAYGAHSTFVADLCYEIGTMSLQDGNFAYAEKYLERAAKEKPNSVMVRVKYADLLMMKGQAGPALQQIEAALKVSPGSPEARQALVKWMMSRSESRGPEAAAANLATTWESYRLRVDGLNSVKSTLAMINRWKNNLIAPPKKAPVESVASASGVAPKPEQPEKEKPKATTKAKPAPKPTPKPAAKPKPKPKATPAPKPQPKPTKTASPPSGKRASSRNGLVPPPPPLVPVFKAPPPPPSGFRLDTDAKIKSSPKPEAKKEKPKQKKPAVEAEPDYLLDWADVDAKKKKGK